MALTEASSLCSHLATQSSSRDNHFTTEMIHVLYDVLVKHLEIIAITMIRTTITIKIIIITITKIFYHSCNV